MLHSFFPLTFVFTSVRISISSFSVFLVESIVAFIFAAILPHVISISVHHAALEHAFKIATIRPLKVSKSTHLIVRPRPRILASICPEVNSLAFFHSVFKVAMVIAPVAPYLDPLTILLVLRLRVIGIHSVVCITKHLLPIILSEHTQLGCFVLLPETLEHFFSWRSEHSNTASLPIDPISFKCASIWPDQFSIATFVVLVVNHWLLGIVLGLALLKPVLLTGIHAGDITSLVDSNESDLSHIFQRTEFHCFDRKLTVFEA